MTSRSSMLKFFDRVTNALHKMASESAGVKREPSGKSVFGGQKTRKEEQIEKRKAELGVCRIRKILKDGAGFQTVGSGAVVKNLMDQWPWKDKCCIVTSDKVLPGKDFHINDFYVEFKKLNSTKPKSFELGNIAMSDAVHRSTSGLVVIPLQDPKAFTIKKSSIFTYRPFTKGNELLNELLSPIVDDMGSSDFDVKPFRLKQGLAKDLQFVLHDGHSSFTTLAEFTGSSNRRPHGSVILSGGENLAAIGILHCRDGGSKSIISPVWLTDETLSGLSKN